MSETTFYASEASKAGKLTQTWTKFGRRIPLWFPDEQIPITAGPGGVISNVIDMVCLKMHCVTIAAIADGTSGKMGKNAPEQWCRPCNKGDRCARISIGRSDDSAHHSQPSCAFL